MKNEIKVSTQESNLKTIELPIQSETKLILTKDASASYLFLSTISKLDIILEENSNLNIGYFQTGDSDDFSSIKCLIHSDASLNIYILQTTGNISLNEEINLAGQNANANNIIIMKSNDADTINTNIKMIHLTPHTTGDNFIQSVALDKSKIIVKGLLRIEKDAQITNTYLQHNTLILGSQAYSNSTPSLEIEANDVKASHGSTTGYIDENHLQYLQSRGIDKVYARELIIDAFIQTALAKITDLEIKEYFTKILKGI